MKNALILVCFLALFVVVSSDRGYGRGRGNQRRRYEQSKNGGGAKSSGFGFNDILNTLLGGGGNSQTWTIGDHTLTLGTDGENVFVDSSVFNPPVVEVETPPEEEEEVEEQAEEEIEIAPWRGEGSFTGDVRIICRRDSCSKGAVQVYNKEKEMWGFICADGWGKEEGDVVCNYLQFTNGSRLSTRLKRSKIEGRVGHFPIFWKDISCTGDENGIISCGGEIVKPNSTCPKDRIAGVACSGKRVNTDTVQTCGPDEFVCGNQAVCLPKSYECDDLADCPWGTDEVGCDGNNCPENQFDCGSGGTKECVINAFRCDGDDDCGNGNDEAGCADHLSHFTKWDGYKITPQGVQSGWRHISAYSCAEKCREQTTFKCVAFIYNKFDRECDLSSLAPPDVAINFASTPSKWATYILIQKGDCDDFKCGTECLPNEVVCNGFIECSDGSDEIGCDTDQNIEIKVVGGVTNMEGQLQARFGNGKWGLICDIGWTIEDANVACRQLGFSYGATNALPGMSFRRSSLPFTLSGVNCRGTESSLNDCRHDGVNAVSCSMDHDAGVACRDSAPQQSTTTRSTTTQPIVSTTPERPPVTTVSPTTDEPQCGVKPSVGSLVATRIVGGKNALAHEFPWQAGLWLAWNSFKCGGTVISSCWILTAAHCFGQRFPLRSYVIRLGDHYANPSDAYKDKYQVDFGVEQIIVHEDYSTVTNDNDIALIKLKPKNGQCANLNSPGIEAACLPKSPTQFRAPKQCVITGWGQTHQSGRIPYTQQLKKANVDLISRSECARKTVYGNRLTNNMLCAGVLAGGIDTCQGDSGGPLSCQDDTDDRYYVWGVVSWGNGCAQPNSPGIYTVVANYVSWIERNMRR